MADPSFAESERDGFNRKAGDYDAVVLPATAQGIPPLLDALGDLADRAVLDLACGTGALASAAVARGAEVRGVDFAADMLAIARVRVPGAMFEVADAQALPFADHTFDAIACNFGLLHVEHPDRALHEAARVLRPGGRLAFTIWCGPGQGNAFFGLILETYQALADLSIALPPAPPMFQLADPAVRDPLLAGAGFALAEVRRLPIAWPLDGPETPFAFIDRAAVRTGMVFARQTASVQRRIRRALRDGTTRHLDAGQTGIPCPAVLVVATRGAE